MELTQIAVFCAGALAYALLVPSRWRARGLMVTSAIAIYWLQPTLDIPQLDFVLPTITIGIAIAGWWFTRPNPEDSNGGSPILHKHDRNTFFLVLAIVLALSATRYLAPEFRLTTRPPETWLIAITVIVTGLVIWLMARFLPGRFLIPFSILAIIAIFIVTKSENLAVWFSSILREVGGRDVTLATASDLDWLGFSYVAFRLIHTLRDRQNGLLPNLTLSEYLTYIIFFPAYTAGPIDRAERFIEDYRQLSSQTIRDPNRVVTGSTRVLIGLFKKFVIADSIALIALNATNADQVQSIGGLWILLYAYAFRLFFDFSGYSDIAIGIGILFGITLPENFNRPYLKNNIMAFWQSWHITLSNWVRFYIFSPLSRSLLRRKPRPPVWSIMFVCHMSTMIVIGLWHGITLTFLLWGAWHGLGLFVHKTWTDRSRKWYMSLKDKPRTRLIWTGTGMFITFHFVVLGWVWFSLPDLSTAGTVFLRLFGFSW